MFYLIGALAKNYECKSENNTIRTTEHKMYQKNVYLASLNEEYTFYTIKLWKCKFSLIFSVYCYLFNTNAQQNTSFHSRYNLEG